MKHEQRIQSLFLIGAALAATTTTSSAQDVLAVERTSAFVSRDLDGDGQADLVSITPAGALRLLRSAGAGFVESTATAGLDEVTGVRGLLARDLDGDGDTDLFVLAPDRASRLFANDGTGRFLDVGEASGLPLTRALVAAEVLDVDRDGALDLFLTDAVSRGLYRGVAGRFVEVPLGLGPTSPPRGW